jgi:hypothetical protein
MDDRLADIFATISPTEVAHVAGAVLEMPGIQPDSVTYSEIKKPHADTRTIGIVRVAGIATATGAARPWSCVTKIIDMSAVNMTETPVDPRNEVQIYTSGLFSAPVGGFRRAHCYHVSRPREGQMILWLEDLTGAEGAPFPIDVLSQMARDLGMWNATTAANPPQIDFAVGRDFQWASLTGFDFPARLVALREIADDPVVRDMYARRPIDFAAEFVEAHGRLARRSLTLPHVLSLADCPVSNFFHLPGQTIAIDWAGLGYEPVGADGGRFIGSAMTWGRDFVEVVRREGELFESYLQGMRAGGSTEDRDILRIGYLSEAAYYLCTVLTCPTIFAGPLAKMPPAFFEKRFEMPMNEFGPAAAAAIDLLPPLVQEMRRLVPYQ